MKDDNDELLTALDEALPANFMDDGPIIGRAIEYIGRLEARQALGHVAEIIDEREKQRAKWGDAHDDKHVFGELASVAGWLACGMPDPWGIALKFANNRRRRLVIAAALLIAELERLDRLEPPAQGGAQ